MLNTAGNNGGAIALLSSGHLSLTGCNASANTAGDYGGGIHLEANAAVVISQSQLQYNRAKYGGGLHMRVRLSCNLFLALSFARSLTYLCLSPLGG